MRRYHLLLFFILLFQLHGRLNAQTASLEDSLERVDQLFSRMSAKTPGASVLISRNGQVIYNKAFGAADLEHAVPNTSSTVFEAGSVSKQFTAAAILLLVKEGKLSLNDDIRKYFPDFPDYGYPITIAHLLHHTSGLRDWGSVAAFGGWPRGTRVYTPAHVQQIIWRQKELNFKPGDEYSYSNSNYNMLTFLVEKVSGQSLQSFTTEKIFKPLGMKNTKWRDNYREIIPNRAIAYNASPSSFMMNMPFENTFGHGALLTTTEDLEKWNQRWKTKSLGAGINEWQRTTTLLNNGKAINYAGGVVVSEVNQQEEISHSGATAGYRAWLAWYPQQELSVVLLSNFANFSPDQTGRAIAALFLGEEKRERKKLSYSPITLSRTALENKAGIYTDKTGEEMQELIFKNDSLRFKNSGLALIPFEQNKFYLPEGFVIQFEENNHQVSGMLFRNPAGDTLQMTKMAAFNPAVKELELFTGVYFSEEADVKMTARIQNDKLQLLLEPSSVFTLMPVYTDSFKDLSAVVYRFLRNRKKQITGFTVTSGRVRNLLFEKVE